LDEHIATAVSADGLSRHHYSPRLSIPFGHFRSHHNASLSERIRTDPSRHLRALEEAAHRIGLEESSLYEKLCTTTTTANVSQQCARIKVSIAGPLQAMAHSPRQLTSLDLRHLVCVQGVATKVSTIKPKIVTSAHYCIETDQISRRNYVDATDPYLNLASIDASTGEENPDRFVSVTTSVHPTRDEDGNPLDTEYGLSIYKDHQTICLQEMPEKAPLGQLPRSVELLLDHDLVDRIKPGDRVMITGVYRAMQSNNPHSYQTAILVNHVQILGRTVSQLTFRTTDIARFRDLGQRPDILDILGRSIAPSIHGHEHIKKAMALQLLSGVEKNLSNGAHLRGDINILMVGDPSTAKSQLLRACLTIAPLAISTTGKGSSGVGLTAAVTTDVDTRERRLEAGAMVLADRGIVCIDEFDKMSENDRVALHEAMEQQTVTIAKAGIHASLNARCAVLAAANPVYGQYDDSMKVTDNVGLPDSLVSRFDLLFVVLDRLDPTIDRQIATHVLQGHRTRNTADHGNGPDETAADDDEEADRDDNDDKMWRVDQTILTLDFLRKYLHYCKNASLRRKPVLTDAVRESIAARYAELRAAASDIAVTARSLETIIRLATAHAKARLSDRVDLPDVTVALDILKFALFHEVVRSGGATTTKDHNKDVKDDGVDTPPVDEEVENTPPPSKRARSSAADNDDGAASPSPHGDKENTTTKPLLAQLQRRIWELLGQQPDESMSVTQLAKELQLSVPTTTTTAEDGEDLLLAAALERLQQDGQVEISNGIIYKY
jgi:DNA replication licensing factor MCM3